MTGQERRDAWAVLLREAATLQADLGRLADELPRELAGLVVVSGDRADLPLGELVRERLQLELLPVEVDDRRPGREW